MNNRFGQELIRRNTQFPQLDFPYSLFGSPVLGRMAEALNVPATFNLMKHNKLEDGSTRLEYNLAGFKAEEISLNVDTATNELIIKAEKNNEGDIRRFHTVITLSPYTSPEDVTTKYEDGVLELTIAPIEKRKEESLVALPLNSSPQKEEKKK